MKAEIAFLTDPAEPRYDALLALYRAAIPARERKSEEEVRAMASSPLHRVAIAQAEGALTGFFLLYVGEAIALLEYLATDPALRGQGLGASLVAAAREAAGGRPLIVEVESDRDSGAPDREMRRRRINFYRRLGCRRIAPLHFVLPLPGDGPPPWLDLLVAGEAGQGVEASRVADWLSEIYTRVYGCDPGDARLLAMIRDLPAVLRLA